MKYVFTIFFLVISSLIALEGVQAENLVATWAMKDGPLMTIELRDQDNFG